MFGAAVNVKLEMPTTPCVCAVMGGREALADCELLVVSLLAEVVGVGVCIDPLVPDFMPGLTFVPLLGAGVSLFALLALWLACAALFCGPMIA